MLFDYIVVSLYGDTVYVAYDDAKPLVDVYLWKKEGMNLLGDDFLREGVVRRISWDSDVMVTFDEREA